MPAMTRPSPLVLVALLLGAAFLATDEPRVRAGVLALAWGIVLVAGGRAAYRRWPRLAGGVLTVAGGLLAAVAFGVLATLNPPLKYTFVPNVPGGPAEVVTTRGFYRSETDGAGNRFAWTQGRATLLLDFLVHRPVTLTVEMRSAALAAGGRDLPVAVVVNDQQVGELRPDPRDPAFQSLSLRFVPPDWGGERSEIKLVAPVFQAPGDSRQLGTMVRAITIDKTEAWSGFARRLWLLWLVPACAALAVAGAWRARHAPTRATVWRVGGVAACAIGGGAAAAITVLLWRIGPIEPTRYLVGVLAGGYLAAAFVTGAIALLAGVPRVQAGGAWLARAVAPLMARRTAAPPRAGQSRGTVGSGWRGVRGDLAAVFAVALAVRVIWALVVPPWLAPDEFDHYVYAAHVAEQGRLPYPDDERYPPYPVEVGKSADLALVPQLSSTLTGMTEASLPYLPVYHDYAAAREYRGKLADRQSAAGARATPYPPLYYLYAAVPYRIAYDTPVITRLYAVRVGSAVLGALACVCGYLFAWESRRGQGARQWGAALGLCMALMPQHGFITASANNDAALFFLCTALCWLLARLWWQSRAAFGLMFALGVVAGAIIVTKPTGLGVVVSVAGLVLLWVLARSWGAWGTLRPRIVAVGAGMAGLLLISTPWFVYRRLVVDAPRPRAATEIFASWAGHFTGTITVAAATAADPTTAPPALAQAAERTYSFAEYLATIGRHEPEHWHWLFVRTVWGMFGWLDEPLPARAYAAITVAVVIGLIGLVGLLLVQPPRRPAALLALALVLGQTAFLFVGADYFEGFRRSGFELGLQGRYFLPVLAPYLFLLLSGWQFLLRDRPVGLRLAPLAMLALLLVGFSTLLATYYGVTFG